MKELLIMFGLLGLMVLYSVMRHWLKGMNQWMDFMDERDKEI